MVIIVIVTTTTTTTSSIAAVVITILFINNNIVLFLSCFLLWIWNLFRRKPVVRENFFFGEILATHTSTQSEGGSINPFQSESSTVTLYTKYFNKLHLNAFNQSKTSQMLDSGRVHVHTWLGRRQGDTHVPSAFQVYFSFEEKTLINKIKELSNMFFSVGFYL